MPWHLGLVNGGACQSAPLTEPYLLWDSRTWDGGAKIYNLGTSGDVFDLHVTSQNVGTALELWAAWKYRNWYSMGSSTAGPHLTGWDDIGGTPSSNPSFTAMYALPDFLVDDPGTDPGLEDRYTEMDFYLDANGALFGSFSGILASGLYYRDEFDPLITDRLDGFMEWFSPEGSFFELLPFDGPPEYYNFLSGKLVTIHVNEECRTADLWVGTDLFLHYAPEAPTWEDPPDPPGSTDDNINDLTFYAIYEPTLDLPAYWESLQTSFDRYFLYFGEHRYGTAPTPGQAWNCGVGAACFRGKPSLADIQYWHNYFYP